MFFLKKSGVKKVNFLFFWESFFVPFEDMQSKFQKAISYIESIVKYNKEIEGLKKTKEFKINENSIKVKGEHFLNMSFSIKL